MKKITFLFVIVATLALVSCGGRGAKKAAATEEGTQTEQTTETPACGNPDCTCENCTGDCACATEAEATETTVETPAATAATAEAEKSTNTPIASEVKEGELKATTPAGKIANITQDKEIKAVTAEDTKLTTTTKSSTDKIANIKSTRQ
jgi:hypothetical protein